MKIHIRLNDKTLSINDKCSLIELLTQENFLENNFAVAINRHFIPRQEYANTFLIEGDVIELVTPMQGG